MNAHRALVRDVLAATRITSPTSYTWFGRPSRRLPPETERAIAPADARAYLRQLLHDEYYGNVYCRGLAAPGSEEQLTPGDDGWFVERLSAANAGTGSWEPGRRSSGTDGDRLVVVRDGLSLWIDPRDARGDGEAFSIRMPKELRRLSPGFYMALGDTSLPRRAVVRFYWHLTADAAPALMRLLTAELNAAHVGFSLKVVSHPSRYTRCDAGVQYVDARRLETVRPIVARAYAAVRPGLRERVPAFTRALAPGLGLAADPGGDQSFGTVCAFALADGVIAADGLSGDAALGAVEAAFAAVGISLDAPHLRAGVLEEDTLEVAA
jgi:class II lanthipeptide synthase